jgi:hypothetical protein
MASIIPPRASVAQERGRTARDLFTDRRAGRARLVRVDRRYPRRHRRFDAVTAEPVAKEERRHGGHDHDEKYYSQ